MSNPIETHPASDDAAAEHQPAVDASTASLTDTNPERPVNEYSTPLEEAVERGLVGDVPHSPGDHPATRGETEEEDVLAEPETSTTEDTSQVAPFVGLQNPHMQAAEKAGSHRKRNILIGAGTAAVATVAAIVTAVSGGGKSGGSADKGPDKAPEATVYTLTAEQRAQMGISPIDLNNDFLNLVLTDGSAKAVSESYDLFNADAKSRITREEWIKKMGIVHDSYHTTTPELQNNDELISAASTHQTVVAKSYDIGNDGHYNITVEEVYDPQTKHWEIDHFDSTIER